MSVRCSGDKQLPSDDAPRPLVLCMRGMGGKARTIEAFPMRGGPEFLNTPVKLLCKGVYLISGARDAPAINNFPPPAPVLIRPYQRPKKALSLWDGRRCAPGVRAGPLTTPLDSA